MTGVSFLTRRGGTTPPPHRTRAEWQATKQRWKAPEYNKMAAGQVWVELVGELVIARVRGEPTEQLLREAQEKVLFLVRDAGRGKVLYDTLEMDPPPVDVPWVQRELDEQLGSIKLRRAIVVPNSRLAFLARIAFGEGDYKVFYNDMISAITWLSKD